MGDIGATRGNQSSDFCQLTRLVGNGNADFNIKKSLRFMGIPNTVQPFFSFAAPTLPGNGGTVTRMDNQAFAFFDLTDDGNKSPVVWRYPLSQKWEWLSAFSLKRANQKSIDGQRPWISVFPSQYQQKSFSDRRYLAPADTFANVLH